MGERLASKTEIRQRGVATIVASLQAVLMLSLVMLVGSDLARRLHPLSSESITLSSARSDLGAVAPQNENRLLHAPDQTGRAKSRPTESSGDALLARAYLTFPTGVGCPPPIPTAQPVALSILTAYQPRAPPTGSV